MKRITTRAAAVAAITVVAAVVPSKNMLTEGRRRLVAFCREDAKNVSDDIQN